jgi:hypothetical protein
MNQDNNKPSMEEVKQMFQEECVYVGDTPVDFYSVSASTEEELEKLINWIQGNGEM